jgi:predicted RNA-binding Zn-ribbon protein involved in translation (DUF1610 family)
VSAMADRDNTAAETAPDTGKLLAAVKANTGPTCPRCGRLLRKCHDSRCIEYRASRAAWAARQAGRWPS